jgi:hypothetical protein
MALQAEDHTLHSHCCEDLRSNKILLWIEISSQHDKTIHSTGVHNNEMSNNSKQSSYCACCKCLPHNSVGNLVACFGELGNTLCISESWFQISACRVAVLTEVICGFVQSLQAIAGTEAQIRPQLLSPTSFPIHLIL